jgi:hypothetical protein
MLRVRVAGVLLTSMLETDHITSAFRVTDGLPENAVLKKVEYDEVVDVINLYYETEEDRNEEIPRGHVEDKEISCIRHTESDWQKRV